MRVDNNYLTRRDTQKLWRAFSEQAGVPLAFRDRFLFKTIYNAALRVSECAALNVGSLVHEDFTPRSHISLVGKGGKFRKIRLKEDFRKEIKKFIKYKEKFSEPLDMDSPLFVSRRGDRLSVRMIRVALEKWLRRAQLDRITVHGLRHSALTHVTHASPQGLMAAQSMAGHSRLETTAIYLHLSPDEHQEALEAGLV